MDKCPNCCHMLCNKSAVVGHKKLREKPNFHISDELRVICHVCKAISVCSTNKLDLLITHSWLHKPCDEIF